MISRPLRLFVGFVLLGCADESGDSQPHPDVPYYPDDGRPTYLPPPGRPCAIPPELRERYYDYNEYYYAYYRYYGQPPPCDIDAPGAGGNVSEAGRAGGGTGAGPSASGSGGRGGYGAGGTSYEPEGGASYEPEGGTAGGAGEAPGGSGGSGGIGTAGSGGIGTAGSAGEASGGSAYGGEGGQPWEGGAAGIGGTPEPQGGTSPIHPCAISVEQCYDRAVAYCTSAADPVICLDLFTGCDRLAQACFTPQ